jgi:hypothetical protein
MNREFEQMQSGGTSEELVFINVNIDVPRLL